MKLHLPLTLLTALLAVMSNLPTTARAAVTGSQTLEGRLYSDETFTLSGEDVIIMNSTSTSIGGTSSISLSSGGTFNMSAGTLGAESSNVTADIGSDSIFTISGGTVAATSAAVAFNVSAGGTLILSSGMSTGTGVTTINVNGGAVNQSGKLADASGSKVNIVVNSGSYTLDGLVAETGGKGSIEVKQGGVFNVTKNGRVSSRNTGSSTILVDGGTFTTSGNVLSSMCSGGTITIQNSGVFTQNEGAVAYGLISSNPQGVAVTISQNGRYQMNGGSFGSNFGSGSKPPVQVSITDGGSFTQTGGDLGSFITLITINVGQGGSYSMSGGNLGNSSGSFDFNVEQGGSFSLSGGAAIIGVVKFNVSGDSVFTQSGGVIKGFAGITLGGAESAGSAGAAFTMTDGDITEHAVVNVEQGTQFEMSGAEAAIGGNASIVVNGGSFTQSNGVFGESATLTLSDGSSYTLQDGTFSAAALSAAGASLHISQQGGSMETELTLAGGAQYTQTGGSFTGSIAASGSGTQATQNAGGTISADVTLSDGATFEQNDNVSGAISISGRGSVYTQKGGSILTGSSISLSNYGAFVQEGGSIMADVALNDATVSFTQSGVISGSVSLSNGATYAQTGGSITGGVSVSSGASFTQSDSATITGKVSVDGSSSSFTQGGSISGDVSVSNGARFNNNHAILGGLTVDHAAFTQTSDISGDVTLLNGGSLDQASGTISGSVGVSGSGSSFSQNQGSIEGSVTLNDGSFTQKSGAEIASGVEVQGGTFTQAAGGSIAGGVSVSNGSFDESGAISGAVQVSGGTFAQKSTGVLTGDVTVSGSGSFTQEASGSVTGAVTQTGGSISQAGSVSGGVTLSKGTYTQAAGGSIGGSVVQTGGSFEQSGSIAGNVEMSGGSFTQKNGSTDGSVAVTGGSFAQQGGSITGAVSVSNGAGYTMSGGSIGGHVDVSSASFTMSGGTLSAGVLVSLTDSTLKLSADASMAADVALAGAKSLYDMGSVAASGKVTLAGGNLANAGQFDGSIVIDTATDYASSVSVGGAAVARISSIRTRSADTLITNVGNGTLTISGADNSMVVGVNTSTAKTQGTGVLISFANTADSNQVTFDGNGKLTLYFSTELILEAAQGELEGKKMSIHLTDGTINLNSLAAENVFIFGTGIAEGVEGLSVDNGNVTFKIDLNHIWIASQDHDVTTAQGVENISKDYMVVVDEDMTIRLPAGTTELTLHQLTGDNSTPGNLSIIADAAQTINLENKNSGGESNGNTVFNGNITVSGAAASSTTLAKTGDATLTLGGVLSTSGTLDVQAGKLVFNSTGNKAGVLQLATDAELSIVGDLTLSGTSAGVAGSITGGGTLTQSGGSLTLGDKEVQANIIATAKGSVTQGSGVITGDVEVQAGSSFTQKADIIGSVSLTGKGAQYEGEGNGTKISGNVTLSGEGAGMDNAPDTIEGNVLLSGTGSSLSSAKSVGGDVTLTGTGASFAGWETDITGAVTLSGEQTQVSNVAGIGQGATLTGASAQLEAGSITGAVVVSGEGAELTANTSIAGSVTLSGKGASVTAGAISGGSIDITGEGSTLKVSSLTDSAITLNGAGATLDLTGATTNSGKLTIYNGSLANAGSYAGEVVINTTDTAGDVSLGGLNGEQVKNIKTSSGISITGLAGSLTLTGMDNMLTLGGRHVGMGGSEAETALVQFADSGTVKFDDAAAVKLQFSEELLSSLTSGKMEVWFTNGNIEGVADKEGSELISWLQTHFLLATGSGVEFAYIESAEGGKLYLTASTRNVWQTSAENRNSLTQVDAFNPYDQVIIDLDTALEVEATEQNNHSIIRQLQGNANLSISNSGSTALTVELRNESYYDAQGNMVTHGATVYGGDLDITGDVNLRKTGNDTLELSGNLNTPGDLDVQNGTLVLNGKANTVGSLSLTPEASTRDDGKDVTTAELVVNGQLALTGKSDLSAAKGAISGAGQVKLQGELKLGKEVTLSGPSMELAAGSSLDVSAAQGTAIGGLSGSGALTNGPGGLTITGGQGVFSGELKGEGLLAFAGETQQTLAGAGNANYDLAVGRKAALTLSADKAAYRTLDSSGVLRIAPASTGAQAAAAAHVEVAGGAVLRAGSTTEFVVNFDSAQDVNSAPALLSSSGAVVLESGLGFVLEGVGMGVAMPTELEITLIRAEGGLFSQEAAGFAVEGNNALEDGDVFTNVDAHGLFSLYYENPTAVVVGNEVKFIASHRTSNLFAEAATTHNSRAGAALLWAAKDSLDPAAAPTLAEVEGAVADMVTEGRLGEARRALAAVAGSTVTALSAAGYDSLRQQLERTRRHAGQTLLHPVADQSRVHAWVEGIGAFAKQNADGDESGYKLNSWGGAVGADMELNENLSMGLALTALYGDLDADAADTATGKLDAYYLSFALRARSGKWSHTAAVVGGSVSASLDRTVAVGSVGYSTSGSTDGLALGVLYEVSYDIALDEKGSSILQPLAGIALNTISMSGYSESGADGAGLRVGDQSRTVATLSLGARWLCEGGANAFGKDAAFEFSAAVAQDMGDTRSKADVALLGNPSFATEVHGAEVGSTALRFGAGVRVPVSKQADVYLNANADIRSGATLWNVNFGVRYEF